MSLVNPVRKIKRNIRHLLPLYIFCPNSIERQGGLLVRSKFIDLAVTASMWFNEGRKISDKEIKDIIASPYLRVEMRTKDDVIILLKQGENIIEPVDIDYEDPCCELCKFDGGNRDRHDFVTSNFLYNKLDPNTKTTIIIKGPYREREYNIDLSRIK